MANKQVRSDGFIEKVTASRFGGWFMTNIAIHIDRWLAKRTAGKISTIAMSGRKMIVLTVIGAKSGKERTVPLDVK